LTTTRSPWTTPSHVRTNTILRKCYTEGNFCDLYIRNEVGDVVQVTDTTQNVGELEADGLDFGFGYNFGETAWGSFRLRLDATYLLNWTTPDRR